MAARFITLPVDRSVEERVAAMAERQCGYVTRAQLLALGLSRHQIMYGIKSRCLVAEYLGVYALGHVPRLPQDRAVGALLACGEQAVLSHRSAAAAWGILRRWEIPFEVTAATARRRRGIEIHRGALEQPDIRCQLGIRVTSPARTLLDIAPGLSQKALRRVVNDLSRRGFLRLHQLADVVSRFPRHPGAAGLRPLLEPPDGNPTRSEFEDDFVAFAERHGLPRPQVNVHVAGREVDAWFPNERVIIELDSWQFHSDRDSFERDRARDVMALELGIATIRLTRARLRDSPDEEAARVLRILASRRQAG